MSRKMKILIVDDEKQIRETIADLLTAENYLPLQAENGEKALAVANEESPDLILIDVMMPGMDGFTLFEKLKKTTGARHVPLIFLSAASQRENRIRAFEMDAEDFIAKPFDAEELLARIASKLRKTPKPSNASAMRCGSLQIDLKRHAVKIGREEIKLSGVELEILKILIDKQSELVRRQDFVRKIWNNEPGSERLIDAHIVSLRKRLKPFEGELRTVYGEGYMLLPQKS